MYSSLISSNDASSCATIADTVGSLYATRFRADEDDGAVQKGRERSPGRWKRDGDGRYTDVEVRSDGPCTTVAASGGVSLPPSVVLALVAEAPVVVLRCLLEVTRHRRAEAETTPVEHARRRAQENICRIIRRCKQGGKWQAIGCFLALALTQWRAELAVAQCVVTSGFVGWRARAQNRRGRLATRTEVPRAKGQEARRGRGPTIVELAGWSVAAPPDLHHTLVRGAGVSLTIQFAIFTSRENQRNSAAA